MQASLIGGSVSRPTHDRFNATHDRRDLRSAGIAAPAQQVDREVLPEPEGWHRAVERDRHQFAQVATLRGFVEHPVGRHRDFRPGDDHGVTAGEGDFDGLREDRPTLDQRVPPDIDAGLFERVGKHANPVLVRV